MNMELFFYIAIIVIALIIAIIVGVSNIESCPYCGSHRIKMRRIDESVNYARWMGKCKKCGEEFYIK